MPASRASMIDRQRVLDALQAARDALQAGAPLDDPALAEAAAELAQALQAAQPGPRAELGPCRVVVRTQAAATVEEDWTFDVEAGIPVDRGEVERLFGGRLEPDFEVPAGWTLVGVENTEVHSEHARRVTRIATLNR